MQDVLVSILINLAWMFVIGVIVYYAIWFYGILNEEN